MYFIIEDMQCHVLDNGARVGYSATLKDGSNRMYVEFSQSGNNIVAYESATDLIHQLILPDGINKIEDLRTGHKVSIRVSAEETASHYCKI